MQKNRIGQFGSLSQRLPRFYRALVKRNNARAAITSNLAAPTVLESDNSFYLTYRPDADIEFGRHPELRALSSKWVANNLANNACDLPRLYALLFNIKQVVAEGIPGDFAELGVYRGNSAAVLAHCARQHRRSVFLFDTFTGFEARDLVGLDGSKERSFADTSLSLVQHTVGKDSAFYMKGHFPETITEGVAERRFAVVHLDCDLYEPMRAGVDFFFPRLSPGGLMIIHDYSNPHWEGAKRAVDEYLPQIPESLILMPDKSGTAMLRKSR